MTFQETLDRQLAVMASIYREQRALSWIVNINAIFLGIIFMYSVVINAPGPIVIMLLLLFIINAVWWFSNHLTKNKNEVKK